MTWHGVAWRGMWICVRSKDAQKQLARTSLTPALTVLFFSIIDRNVLMALVFYYKDMLE